MNVLVADDDPRQLNVLEHFLREWGHSVDRASDGHQALAMAEQNVYDLLISDWQMPGLSGLELCERIRRADRAYIYVILLTGRREARDIIQGIESGADEYLVKPVNYDELRARLRVAERIIGLERSATERNRQLTEALHDLNEAYDRIRKDLEAAARMQQSLLPSSFDDAQNMVVKWLFIPCSIVAGDIFGVVPLEGSRTAFFLVDVAGHGISAAMMSVSVGRMIAAPWDLEGMHSRTVFGSNHRGDLRPSALCRQLNRAFLSDNSDTPYFTMVFGVLDVVTGEGRLVQAGNPHPVIVRKGGAHELVGEGGCPIGLFADSEWSEVSFRLQPGDSLCLYSDGVVECAGPGEEPYGMERLLGVLSGHDGESPRTMLDALSKDLRRFRGDQAFDDDVSVLMLHRRGGDGGAGR